MHVIAMYDVNEKRVGKVLKIFRKYLTWIQLSVFEGEINDAALERLKIEIKDIIDSDTDSVLFFQFSYNTKFKKVFVGKNFNPFDNIF